MMHWLDDIERFIRASYLGHTWMLVLLGAASFNPNLPIAEAFGLLVIALNFHCFGYVHNDLIDLHIDRTQALRASDPLVRGSVRPTTAWLFALAQIVVSAGLAIAMSASPTALTVLAIGYGATVLYNLYGKKCPIPPLTDGVQGIAWGSLAAFGALMAGGMTWMALLPVGFGFSYIFLINGVHGGLRDLRNDLQHERHTTAIFFGARPGSAATSVIPTTALRVFAGCAFALLLLPGIALASIGQLPYSGTTAVLTLTLWAMTQMVAGWLLFKALRPVHPQRNRVISQNQLPLLLPPLILMLPMLAGPLQLLLLACFFGPLLLFIPDLRHYLLPQSPVFASESSPNPSPTEKTQ